MTALDSPPIASRLRDVASSPVREILALTARPGVISFAGGLPAPELFDAAGLREAFAAALSDERAGRSLQYSTTEGDPELRAAIASRLTARGLPTEADELLVTSGSQQALTLAAAVLIEPGDRVLVEEPSYLAALQAFALAGAVVVPVACDGDGLDPDAVAAAAEEHGARLLYTIPTFHNPTGRTLPLERRRALAAIAERHGLWLIEDDPYGELRYRGEPLPSLATMAEDRTLALSTLSKVAAPGLRIGWVRTPPALRHALVVAKQAADLHSSTVDQAAAARWLGHRRPRRAHRRPARRVRPPPRRAARRPAGCAASGVDPQPPRGRHVRLGAAARRLGRGAAAGPRARARRRLRARLSVLRRRARPRDAAVLLHDPFPGRDRRGSGAVEVCLAIV